MSQLRLGDIGYHGFDWPECLVIDLLCDHYREWVDRSDCIVLARLQQRSLRDLYFGEIRRSAEARQELSDFAACLGLSPDLLDRADRLVFWDLIKLVKIQFRTSPRSRVASAERLHQALGRLVEDAAPQRTSVFAAARSKAFHARNASVALA